MDAEGVKSGDQRRALEAIRDRLVAELESPDSSAAVASLSKQLVDVLGRIAALPAGKASAVDDLSVKRARRRAGAPDAPAKGGLRRSGSDSTGG